MTTPPNSDIWDAIIIGGGAGGFFCAISIVELTHKPVKVLLLEGTPRVLTKVKISGGGRCNVTNAEHNPKQLIKNYPRGGKKLLNGFFKFGPKETIAWFANRGVSLVAEPDGRMFPTTNSSQTIINCFQNEVDNLGIDLRKKSIVESVRDTNNQFEVVARTEKFFAKHVVIATGSSPMGHKIAKDLGHNITPLAPSLFTLKSEHPVLTDLPGVSCQDVEIELIVGNKSFHQRGPILFTHWGFSGPAVLKLSAFAAREFLANNYEGHLKINWLPNQNQEQTFVQLKAIQKDNARKLIHTTKAFYFPKRLWHRLVKLAVGEDRVWNETSDRALRQLGTQLHGAKYEFSGKGEFKEEFVTCGGVDLAEIDLKGFESKVSPGLYFCGEVLDIDGITGGFNFQNAWTSARLAASSIANSIES